MPQLDKFSFATQIFWFSSFFIFYYIILINKFLPNFFKILRFRQYRLFLFSFGIKKYIIEEHLILQSYIFLLRDTLNSTLVFFFNFNKIFLDWINLNKNYFI